RAGTGRNGGRAHHRLRRKRQAINSNAYASRGETSARAARRRTREAIAFNIATAPLAFRPMWLYRAMPLLSEVATRSYYRVTVAGARVPAEGPVLLVANHNNSLV